MIVWVSKNSSGHIAVCENTYDRPGALQKEQENLLCLQMICFTINVSKSKMAANHDL